MSAATVLADLKRLFGSAWLTNSDAVLTYLSTSLAQVSDVTPGTVLASSAVVVDASKNISSFNNVGLAGTLTFGAGGQINSDSGTATAVGTGGTSTATVSKMAGVITTDAITTAAAAAHVMTITNVGVATGDLIFISQNGGSASTGTPIFSAVASTDTITVTISNKHASAAFNAALIFSFLVVKA